MSNAVAWPDDHTSALRELHAEGLSFSQIAGEINRRFRSEYSRNATIGRAYRIGLTRECPRKKIVVRYRTTRKPPQRHVRIVASNGNSNSMRMLESVESDAPALRCAEIVSLGVSLLDLTTVNCRYPYGEGAGITFCGHPKCAWSSYCMPHYELARGRGTESERAATKGISRLLLAQSDALENASEISETRLG